MRWLALALALLIVLVTGTATAEPSSWYEGRAGRRRVTHLVAIAAGGALYASSETFLKDDLAPATCRRCEPLGLDRSVRNAVVWDDPSGAGMLSNLTGYVLAPVVGLWLGVFASPDPGGDRIGRWIDDAVPILEAAVFAGLVNQAVKLGVGRQRPFVHFGDPARPPELDDNLSFYSGHTTLAFAIATSAGIVAHRRRSPLEPVIWSAGYALAAATGYLRMGADKHYLTDVAVGAAAGAGIGLAVPLLLHGHLGREAQLGPQVVPTGRGIALAGRF